MRFNLEIEYQPDAGNSGGNKAARGIFPGWLAPGIAARLGGRL